MRAISLTGMFFIFAAAITRNAQALHEVSMTRPLCDGATTGSITDECHEYYYTEKAWFENIMSEQYDQLKRFIKANPSIVNAKNDDGDTALEAIFRPHEGLRPQEYPMYIIGTFNPRIRSIIDILFENGADCSLTTAITLSESTKTTEYFKRVLRAVDDMKAMAKAAILIDHRLMDLSRSASWTISYSDRVEVLNAMKIMLNARIYKMLESSQVLSTSTAQAGYAQCVRHVGASCQ